MDYEDFLSIIYTPLKSIELLSDIIYTKTNEDWELFNSNYKRKEMDELLALNFATKLCARYILKQRSICVDKIDI